MNNLVMNRQDVRALRKRTRPTKGIRAWIRKLQEQRKESAFRPGMRGWRGAGVGRACLVEPSKEVLGTTVQVCGYWPYSAGSVAPAVGIPLGLHLLRGFPVSADPVNYFLAKLINNPSLFIMGRPGLGKSTVARRLETMYGASGVIPMILGDLKPDHVDVVRAMGGVVIEVGPGRNAVNPLDRGPLVTQLSELSEGLRKQTLAELGQFQRASAIGLLQQAGRRPLTPHEETIVSRALRVLSERITGREPVLPDMLKLIEERDSEIDKVADTRGRADDVYQDRTRHLRDVLQKLGPDGPYGDLLSRETTIPIPLDRPVAFDLSAIDQADRDLQAAVQVTCWGYGSAAVSATRVLGKAEVIPERHYVLVMDEMWRMLRADPKLVKFIDDLSRLNRTIGTAQIMITHTMNDLKLPTQEDTTIAWGLVERAGMLILGGLAEAEMGNLATVFALSEKERDMVTSWSSEATINPETGVAADAPGMGHFLLKIGKKPGIPFRTVLTDVERDVNDTNKSWAGASDRFRQLREQTIREVAQEEAA